MLGRLLLLCGLFAAAAPAAALTIYKYTDANGVVTYSDRAVAGRRDGHEHDPDADHGHELAGRPVANGCGEGAIVADLGQQEPQSDVTQRGRPARRDRGDDHAEAQEEGVEVPVPGQPAADAGDHAVGALAAMVAAAEGGWQSTKALQARVGRASRLGERSIGVLDAGSTSCFLLLKTLGTSVQKRLG